MSNFVRILGSLLCFVFGIILLPVCFVVGLLFSFYFTYELVVMYFTTVSDTFNKKKEEENKEDIL